MTKYQKYFQEMMDDRFEQFKRFKDVHDNYVKEPEKWKDRFNSEGKIILSIIREWEKRLCSHSERGQYGIYSSKLADKFWDEIRKNFPKIDFVGVK